MWTQACVTVSTSTVGGVPGVMWCRSVMTSLLSVG
jgi:hypothetical protein